MGDPVRRVLCPAPSRRQVLLGATLAAATLALPGCRGGSSDGTGPDQLRGLVGDGVTDDGPALQQALDALGEGDTLRLDDGARYAHSTVLRVTVPGTALVGAAELVALDEERSALRVEADRVRIDSLTLSLEKTTRRWEGADQHRLYATGVRGLTVRGVTVAGSAASGVFLDDVSEFVLEDVEVHDSRADGIHLTRGTRQGRVTRPRTARTGDDGVAVVSYEKDGAVCSDIEVTAPVVRVTKGRGVSVIGGRDIRYRDIDVEGSAAAGVYVACEGAPFFTTDVQGVQVIGGRLAGTNTDATIDHGQVLVFTGRDGGKVQDVRIEGLTLTGLRPGASRQVGVIDSAGDVSGVVLAGLAVERSPEPFTSNGPPGCCETTGWTTDGSPIKVSS